MDSHGTALGGIDVTAAIIYGERKVLVARRPAGKHLAGYWEFPGGKVELDETPEKCLAREILEELNLEIRVGGFIAKSIHDYGDKRINLMAYEVREYSGDLVLAEHDEIAWVDLAELRTIKLAPADVPLIEPIEQWFSE